MDATLCPKTIKVALLDALEAYVGTLRVDMAARDEVICPCYDTNLVGWTQTGSRGVHRTDTSRPSSRRLLESILMCGLGLELCVFKSPSSLDRTSRSAASCHGPFPSTIPCLPGMTEPHDFERRLGPRGPDHYDHCMHGMTRTSTTHEVVVLALHSAVLHLRGEQLIPQPRVDADHNILCWNGELFGMMNGRDRSCLAAPPGNDDEVADKCMHESDTVVLSDKLQRAGQELARRTTEAVVDPVVEVLRRVHGPFAVVWLHVETQRVYFGHDRFGRRSLLYQTWGTGPWRDRIEELAGTDATTSKAFALSDLTRFVLSSVVLGDTEHDRMQYQELPASGIYVLDLRASTTRAEEDTVPSFRMEFYPYAPVALPHAPLAIATPAADVVDRFGCKLPFVATSTKTDVASRMLESAGRALLIALSDAVGVRVRSIPSSPLLKGLEDGTARVAVLFSGGLDSVVLAALTHFHAPPAEPVDLLTVCFDERSNFASPDRRAAELAHAELCTLFPARQWNLIQVNVSRAELSGNQRDIQMLMAPCNTHMDFNIGAAFWFLSRGRGVLTKLTQASEIATLDELNTFLQPSQANLPEQKTTDAALSLFDDWKATGSALLCPVMCCGRKRTHGCVVGVCKRCCFKIQRAVKKLVPLASQHADQLEAQGFRANLLSMGISEGRLDLLLHQREEASKEVPKQQAFSCCVHRAKQTDLPTQSDPTLVSTRAGYASSTASHYQTNARVVLVGIGADEQLAGYGRHRTTLINEGEQALRAELKMDLDRIWKRNLGRDDRCIAAHGREARFPYLDETVVSTISTFPVSSLCDVHLPRGVGDKRVLRLVATTLGLTSCAGLAKRAIQFGSRIAKVSNTGSNRQTQGQDKFSGMG